MQKVSLLLSVPFYIWLFESCATLSHHTPGFVEVNNHPLGMCHAGATQSDEEYELLDTLGVDWLRVDYRWDRIEKSPGEFSFASMDDYTQKAIGNNKKILAVLCYDTPWIHADNKRHFYIPPEKHDLFVRFVSKTVSRYKDKVAAIEIWNEPNNRMKTFWGGPDEVFFELVKKTVTAIREIDDQIIVVTPGLFRGDSGYLEKMFKAGALHQVDVVSFHPYGMTLKGYLNQIRKINDIRQRSGFKGEIWITEMGFPTGGLYPWRSSEDKLPARIIKTLTSGFSMNIQTIMWYELFDRKKPRKLNSEDFFGLIKRNKGYEYKKGAYAFSVIARNIPGTRLVNNKVKCNNPSTHYYYFQKSDGRGLLAIWNKRRQKTVISIPGKNCVRWSISSPEREELDDGQYSVKAGREPLVFTFSYDSEKEDFIKIKHLTTCGWKLKIVVILRKSIRMMVLQFRQQ